MNKDIVEQAYSSADPLSAYTDLARSHILQKAMERVDEPYQEVQQQPIKIPENSVDRAAMAIGIDQKDLDDERKKRELLKSEVSQASQEFMQAGEQITDVSREVVSDVSEKATSLAKQVPYGLVKAAEQTLNGAIFLSDRSQEVLNQISGFGPINIDSNPNYIKAWTKSLPEPKSWDEALVRDVTSVVVPYLGWARALSIGGSVPALESWLAMGAASASSMDPHEEGISDLLKKHTNLQVPVIDFFAQNPNDTEADKRMKNFISGFAMGALGDAFFGALKSEQVKRFAKSLKSKSGEFLVNDYGTAIDPPSWPPGGKPPVKPPTTEMKGKGITPTEANAKLPETLPPETPIEDVLPMSGKEFSKELGLKPSQTMMDIVNSQIDNDIAEKQARAVLGDINIDESDIKINYDKFKFNKQDKELIKRFDNIYSKIREEARRGVRSREQTLSAAEQSSLTKEKALKLSPGSILNAEDTKALEMLWTEQRMRVSELAKELLKGNATPAMQAAWTHQSNVATALGLAMEGNQTEIGRALESLKYGPRVNPSNINNFIKNVNAASGGGLSVQDQARLFLAAENMGGDEALKEAVKRGIGTQIWDGLGNVIVSWMLTGPAVFKGAFDLSNAVMEPIFTLGAVPVSTAKNIGKRLTRRAIDPGTSVTFGEAGAQVMGQIRSLQDAFHAAWLAAKGTEITPAMRASSHSDYVTGYKFPIDEQTSIDRAFNVLAMWGLGPRAISGGNAFVKTVMSRGYIYKEAVSAAEVAEKTGIQGFNKSEFINNFIKNPPEQVIKDAEEYGLKMASAGELTGPGKAIDATIKWIPILNQASIFRRISLNNIGMAMERSPLGLVRGIYESAGGIKSDFTAGGRKRDIAISRFALGSAAMTMFGLWAGQGRLSGARPKNPAQAAIWDKAKITPYSFNFEGEWYQFSEMGTLGKMLELVADASQSWADMEKSGDIDIETISAEMIGVAAHFMTPDFIMDNVGEFIDILENKDKGKFKKFVAKMSQMPTYGGMGWAGKMFDPTRYDVSSDPNKPALDQIVEGFKNRLSVLSPFHSKDVPPALNMFGEPVIYGPGYGFDSISPIYMTKQIHSPAVDEMLRLGITGKVLKPADRHGTIDAGYVNIGEQGEQYSDYLKFGMPPRFLSRSMGSAGMPGGENSEIIKLTPWQYHRFVRLSAGLDFKNTDGTNPKPLINALDDLVKNEFKDSIGRPNYNDNYRRAKINQVIMEYRQNASERMLMEIGSNDITIGKEFEKRFKAKEKTRVGRTETRGSALGIRMGE